MFVTGDNYKVVGDLIAHSIKVNFYTKYKNTNFKCIIPPWLVVRLPG